MRSVNVGLIILLVACTAAAQTSLETLEGGWVTTNPRTRGLTSIIVSQNGADWTVQAWGKCHPRDCDWGITKLLAVGDSVEDQSFDRGFAMWNAGFADKYVSLSLHGDNLRIETITVFKDRSRRANYRTVEIMRRAEQTGGQ